jgi:hypothetical protein
MKNTILLCIFICISPSVIKAQDLKQTIRGTVIDKDSKTPLTGATVVVAGTEPLLAAVAGTDGEFMLGKVSVGRHNLKVTFIGYHEISLDLFLTSGKETVVNIELEEKVETIDEVMVKSYNRKDQPVNEMALISARSFSIEETERFAGSLGDPARMVANYAGVMTQDDSRNDIIIRGNSPAGVLWKLDGIEVPNPNHFGSLGTTGGPVSMVNNNLLNNSDFYTGAFTAEYGNALSGAFDLKLRSGNNQEKEFTGQVGFNGFELGVEGPFVKGKKASYLANYRYSTLALMHLIGFGTETGSAVPYYQDLTFKIDIPGTKLGRFTIIGLGGKSKIDIIPDTSVNANGNAYNSLLTHTKFSSDLGVVGITNLYFFNERTRLETNVSLQGTGNKTLVDSMNPDLTVKRKYYRSVLTDIKASFSAELKSKLNNKNSLSGGIIADLYYINYNDSVYDTDYRKFITVTEIDNKQLSLIRGFGQWQHKFTDELTLYGGIHAMFFGLNNEISVEPRVSAQWKFHPKQSFNLGYGIHSQMQPRMVYFTQSYDSLQNKYRETNHDVKFSKSDHYILGYNYLINKNFRLKIETYYQYLYNIPIANDPMHFSMLNAGDNFSVPAVDSLVNNGKGKNYGVELTFEKFLSKGYYFLFTASVFDSKFKAVDNIWRNTAFNGSYVFNALGGYEIKIKGKNYLTFDIKVVWAGGRRYVPFKPEVYDLINAVKNNPGTPVIHFNEIYDIEKSYSARYQNYIRTDFRIGYKLNHKKYSEEFGLDLQNITNQKALFSQEYDRDHGKLINSYQQGFSPMFLYRIQF